MHELVTGSRWITFLAVIALIVFAASRIGYGQNTGQVTQAAQCPPFQNTIAVDINAGDAVSVGTVRTLPRTSVTIEQIALRIDAVSFVAPVVAIVTTTVGSVTSAYYVPVPSDNSLAIPQRPITLMQAVRLHADGGTVITFSIAVDSRVASGNGRAEWSVSGLSCPA